jgi:hypothetical protein
MIELDDSSGLKGLPTAKCTEHGLVLRPEPVSAHPTLTVTWSCPICTAEESISLKGLVEERIIAKQGTCAGNRKDVRFGSRNRHHPRPEWLQIPRNSR